MQYNCTNYIVTGSGFGLDCGGHLILIQRRNGCVYKSGRVNCQVVVLGRNQAHQLSSLFFGLEHSPENLECGGSGLLGTQEAKEASVAVHGDNTFIGGGRNNVDSSCRIHSAGDRLVSCTFGKRSAFGLCNDTVEFQVGDSSLSVCNFVEYNNSVVFGITNVNLLIIGKNTFGPP